MLDYFIVNEPLLDIMTTCKINPGYRSDHSSLQLNILINSFQQGKNSFQQVKGIWKLNYELLEHLDYVRTINQIIQEVRSRYSIPVCAQNYINEANNLDLLFTIDIDLLLEVMLLEIRYIFEILIKS